MRHGDLSNKPALTIVVRLDSFANVKVTKPLKRLKIDIPSYYPIAKLNDYFCRYDIQIVVIGVLPKKYQPKVEEALDNAGLLYMGLILEDSELELKERIAEERFEELDEFIEEILWT